MKRKLPWSPRFFFLGYFIFSGSACLYACYYVSSHNTFLASFVPEPPHRYPPIGQVLNFSGDTRLRVAGELLWTPLQDKTAVHEYDTIFTGSDGAVTLKLRPSTTLKIAKDSLIKISQQDHLTTLQLFQGQIDASSPQQDTLKVKALGHQKTLHLTGVDEQTTYHEFLEGRITAENLAALPQGQDFADVTDDPAEDSVAEPTLTALQNLNASPEANTTSKQAPLAESLNNESSVHVLQMLGVAYFIFTVVALREALRLRDTA